VVTRQDGMIKMGKMAPDDFFKWLVPTAVPICKSYGLPSSVLLAQAALESGWNESTIGQFNLFGRKWNGVGDFIEDWTREEGDKNDYEQDEQHIYLGDSWWKIWAKFQNYASLKEAINDWCILITMEPSYKPVNDHLDNLDEFVRTLAPIYATYAGYANDILMTICANNLTQYDT
jgi:flagellum-specific peptidoglycan hydrolase FlgJ